MGHSWRNQASGLPVARERNRSKWRQELQRTSDALGLQVGNDSLNFCGRPAGEGGRERGHVAHALCGNPQVLQQLQLRPVRRQSAPRRRLNRGILPVRRQAAP